MASISTSYSQQRHGFIRVENEQSHDSCDYPLYRSSSVKSGIDVVAEGPVVENAQYNLWVLLPTQLDVTEISISVNGSDPITSFAVQNATETVSGQDYCLYQIAMRPAEKRLFLLTFGFARIEVALSFAHGADDEDILTTKDIPCMSNEDYQAPMIAQMLNELLDVEEETVARWMFMGNDDNRATFSIIDAAFRDNSPKSLSSIIQLFESVIVEYENSYDYFRSHGFSRIIRTKSKQPPRSIRRTGSHELLWMAKNAHTLSETPYETSIDYLGRYYLPREVETDIRVKSYDSYENRLVLGFLDELLANAKVIHACLKSDIASIRDLEERLNPIQRNEYSLPALTLVRQCAERENYHIAKLQGVIEGFRKLKRKYELALPDVKAVFTRSPRRTKVFQEVKSYSGIYTLIMRWLKFGDFTLARENLALHSLRLDKLYEYFALFRLLCWFHNAGFTEDKAEETPIERASFSLRDRFYTNEKQVATLYKLSCGNTRIKLYYQPVIYGDNREENGITLHRLSCRSATSQNRHDSYWTPDFMLQVSKGSNAPDWHIFDAKFSKASSLWGDYPKEGPFTTMMSKYKTDICGANTNDKVISLWLFSGRDPGQHLQHAELSSWARQHFSNLHSGIGALTPSYSCLSEVLGPILGIDNHTSSPSESTSSETGQSVAEPTIGIQPVLPDSTTQPTALMPQKRNKPSNRCMPLINELYSLVEDSELLYKSRWSEMNLGIAHPLLRKSAPKGRERRYYTKAEVCGEACYAYSYWLPNSENKLRSYVEKNRPAS